MGKPPPLPHVLYLYYNNILLHDMNVGLLRFKLLVAVKMHQNLPTLQAIVKLYKIYAVSVKLCRQ